MLREKTRVRLGGGQIFYTSENEPTRGVFNNTVKFKQFSVRGGVFNNNNNNNNPGSGGTGG